MGKQVYNPILKVKIPHEKFGKSPEILVYFCIPMEMIIQNEAELETAVPRILEYLGDRRKIALYGDLGAGKTTLVKAICRSLGVKNTTGSPTFSLINVYHYTDISGREVPFHHLDLYRIRSASEAFDVGVLEVIDDPWFCCIEWPQVIEPWLPEDAVKIEIEIMRETVRRVLIL